MNSIRLQIRLWFTLLAMPVCLSQFHCEHVKRLNYEQMWTLSWNYITFTHVICDCIGHYYRQWYGEFRKLASIFVGCFSTRLCFFFLNNFFNRSSNFWICSGGGIFVVIANVLIFRWGSILRFHIILTFFINLECAQYFLFIYLFNIRC